MTVRLGFVGTGWIGRHRMQALVDSGHARVAAIVEPDPDALAQARAIAPDAAVFADLAAMLAHPLDGVVIATPSALHTAQTIAALERGLAVFCQKPLGRDADETRAALAAARAADRLLGVDFSYRRTRAVTALRDRVATGAIGRVHAVELRFDNAYGPGKSWFRDPALAGGGCLVDLGSHLVDLVRVVLGPLVWRRINTALFAHGARIAARTAVEDLAYAQLEAEDGTVVRLACSWELPAGQDAVIEARLIGRTGALVFANQGGSFYDFTLDQHRGTARERLVDPPDDWGGREAVAWAAQLVAARGYDPAAESYLWTARTLDAIYRAAA